MDPYLLLCNSTELCFVVPTGTKREDWSKAALWTGSNYHTGAQELARLNRWKMIACPACAGSKCELCNFSGWMSEQHAASYERKRKRED